MTSLISKDLSATLHETNSNEHLGASLEITERKIELVGVGKLKPYVKNARVHSPEQIDQIAKSILEFGWTNPILVDSAKGIIAGHGRLKAAEQLKLKQVPVIFLDHLTDVQKKAYLIADNKIAENATWDKELLTGELQELAGEAFDLESLGFSDKEISDLLGDDESFDDMDDEKTTPQNRKLGSAQKLITCPECHHRFTTTDAKAKPKKKKIKVAAKVVKRKKKK